MNLYEIEKDKKSQVRLWWPRKSRSYLLFIPKGSWWIPTPWKSELRLYSIVINWSWVFQISVSITILLRTVLEKHSSIITWTVLTLSGSLNKKLMLLILTSKNITCQEKEVLICLRAWKSEEGEKRFKLIKVTL